jgi:hypothetical protein
MEISMGVPQDRDKLDGLDAKGFARSEHELYDDDGHVQRQGKCLCQVKCIDSTEFVLRRFTLSVVSLQQSWTHGVTRLVRLAHVGSCWQ